ncbi:MAG: antibiotic biosynthesis monooxygenase [Jaaginema sp. PMC 1079.18]|nr:antibiotic biosynthesis monooxygenase [Jaaginema sp. PMC 1080.18]MEC4852727.1 antibiotic biosynthesis monooxygenase [Jaaginema sp. PMC 1079.18]MEC4865635.1 antibiotic biosynthesis monooxygenase [Jaaginema sp. PMC 1078.18]
MLDFAQFQSKYATVVNVFTVNPGQQDVAFERIQQIYTEVVKEQTGFIDATLLKSDDGKKVTAVAHWHSAENLQALRHNTRFHALHDAEFWQVIERVEPHVYSDRPAIIQGHS